MAAVIWCRLLYSNEIAAGGSSSPVDGQLVKKIASGGDVFTFRTNFTDEVSRIPSFTYMLACNDRPCINPPDALSTCSIYEFQNQFFDATRFETQRLTNVRARLGDPETKSKLCRDPEWRAAVVWLVLEAWTDKLVRSNVVEQGTADLLELDGSLTLSNVCEAVFSFGSGFMVHEDITEAINEYSALHCPDCHFDTLSVQKRSATLKGFGCEAARRADSRGMTGLVLKALHK
jgi:hypothetical protein